MEGPLRDPELKLIETFRWSGNGPGGGAGAGYVRLHLHRARMAASAAALGLPFAHAAFDAALPADPGPSALRVRLTLDRAGRFGVTMAPLPPNPPEWRLALATGRIDSRAPERAHKTTARALYDHVRTALPAGVDEVLFLNETGEVAEGTITNLFFDLGDGLCTPPLGAGCLPGCLRAELLATGEVREARLDAEALPRARLWAGNSLRGLIPARMVSGKV